MAEMRDSTSLLVCTPTRKIVRQKRVRDSPLTPYCPRKRIPRQLAEPRQLCFADDESGLGMGQQCQWSETEVKTLVEFVLFHSSNKWPTHKHVGFWRKAGIFVKNRAGTSQRRSGDACRFKVIGHLKKHYRSPAEAEIHFFGETTSNSIENSVEVQTDITFPPILPVSEAEILGQRNGPDFAAQPDSGEQNLSLVDILNQLSLESLLEVMSKFFTDYVTKQLGITVPDDFLVLAAKAMAQLNSHQRSNVVYNLAKGLGTPRADGSDSKFPTRRMPMGLLEHATNYFVADNMQQVPPCPMDYRVWQQTMYTHFGQKWSNLHHGPMWNVASCTQTFEQPTKRDEKEILEALVNIPAVSARTLRRDIEGSSVVMTSQIQTAVLDEAAQAHPDTWWWLKGDGCDINEGLKESTKLQWSGDVDLNDGCLQEQYESYRKRLAFAEQVGLTNEHNETVQQVGVVSDEIAEDLKFIHSALAKANTQYAEKQQSGACKEKTMITLAWNIKELADLNESGRKLMVDLNALKEKLQDDSSDWVEENIPRRLSAVRQRMTTFIRAVSRHKRTPATHILVFMISPEGRNKKPYALPVQCLPYKGITDAKARLLANEVISEMTKRKMKVAGFATNGEWNSLRTKGNTRPISVLQIRSNVRAKYSRMNLKKLIGMLTPKVCDDGSIIAGVQNPAVSSQLLHDIFQWLRQGVTLNEVLQRLRLRTVPPGYIPHNWLSSRKETEEDMLRSILSQLDYRWQINSWLERGVNFKDHLYVPEVHPETGLHFCEREDEGHVFKRIGQSLRLGGPRELKLERFEEALHDSTSGLTHTALSGIRKQSVEDVERLFGEPLILWMEKKGYNIEAEYLRAVRGWRRACDERGLSHVERSQYNKKFLDYVLDDLMPWHRDQGLRDFSLLEVNRNVASIRGFSRETLNAVIANIEWRREFCVRTNIPQEHPRASTTDDVECFFSVLRDSVGKDFTLKEVFYGWRKVTNEFLKRMNPDLPFYYYTSSHTRYYEGVMTDFSVKASKPRNTRRAPQRELLAADGRVKMAIRGASSIRATFHNVPVDLPPPPGAANQVLCEHSYV